MDIQAFNHHDYLKNNMNNYIDSYSIASRVNFICKVDSEVFKSEANGYAVYTVSYQQN
jgi:hypothetical protein